MTVTAASTSTTYGAVPIVARELRGFQNGDGIGSLATLPTCSSTVTALSVTATYPGANTCSGAASANYSFSYVSGDTTVDPAALTVAASSTSTFYGTLPIVTASYAGFPERRRHRFACHAADVLVDGHGAQRRRHLPRR